MSKSVEDLLHELRGAGVLEGSGQAAPPAKQPRRAAVPAADRLRSPSLFIILAVILVALIGSLPIASYALYPFTLLVTLIHETSHAVAATATGGQVSGLEVRPDFSGVTMISGGFLPLVASAGYLGATLSGIALLLTPLKRARVAIWALTAVPLAALILFHPASLFTVLTCLLLAAGLGAAAWKLPWRALAFLQIFIGVEAGLNALRDLLTLLFISGSGAHIHSDATLMSGQLFLPPIFWAVLWTVLSVVLLGGALVKVVRRDARALRSA